MPTTVFDLSKFVFPLDRGEADEVLLDVPASDAAGPNESLRGRWGSGRVSSVTAGGDIGLEPHVATDTGFVPQCEMEL